jgi:hypothetical protein
MGATVRVGHNSPSDGLDYSKNGTAYHDLYKTV